MEKKNKIKLRYITYLILLIFLIYHSIEFENLDDKRKKESIQNFDPVQYTNQFWDERLSEHLSESIPCNDLLMGLEKNILETAKEYGRTLGIASTHFFMVQGRGTILESSDEGLIIGTRSDQKNPDVILATSYIFGNAIRDASGLIDVNDFPSSMDFNNISGEINKKVIQDIVPSFISNVKVGGKIKFFGASEVNEENPEIYPLKVIPVKVRILEK